MKKRALTFLISLLAMVVCGRSETGSVPPIVAKGFEEFQKNGTLAGVNVWLAGSSRDNDDDQDRATTKVGGIQQTFGRMLGYEVVRVVTLTASTQRVYAAVKFEKGVAWMSFDCYRPDKDWIISRFDFGTNANLILPPNILGGQ